jgi:hypothetical protein
MAPQMAGTSPAMMIPDSDPERHRSKSDQMAL